MKPSRIVWLATLVGLVAFAAVGCGGDDNGGGSAGGTGGGTDGDTASAEPITIGFINLSDEIPFSLSVREGIEEAASQNDVEVISCDSQLSVETAISCAQQFKTQGVDGILNFQADQAAASRVCDAGPDVPVVAIDIPQEPCQDVYFGADNREAGRIAGATLGEFAKQEWNCEVDAVLSINTPVNELVQVREDGALEGMESQCPGLEVIKVTPGEYTTDATIQPFTDTLTRLAGQDRLLVLATNDDTAIGAVRAAQAAGRLDDIYVAAQGADPTAWPYICGETEFENWVADVGYFPDRYGENVVPILVSLIQGEEQPETVYLEHEAVTPENITSFYPDACE